MIYSKHKNKPKFVLISQKTSKSKAWIDTYTTLDRTRPGRFVPAAAGTKADLFK